ncbi:trimeric intracellular cation channel family protein [Pelagibaculum spongiae]|nr:trimeric intracellular cation channel family protein [Pelagibaculum spongiae]
MSAVNAMLFLDLFGTVVFAISGALVACRKGMDVFGAFVLAIVTAMGGGTVRDLQLGTDIFWMQQPIYLWIAVAAAIITLAMRTRIESKQQWLLLADALGLAAFTVIGVDKALSFECAPIVAVVMGVLTGAGGGLIRDVLAGQSPMIFYRDIYATAIIAGAGIYQLLLYVQIPVGISAIICMAVVLGMRLVALRRSLSLPSFLL